MAPAREVVVSNKVLKTHWSQSTSYPEGLSRFSLFRSAVCRYRSQVTAYRRPHSNLFHNIYSIEIHSVAGALLLDSFGRKDCHCGIASWSTPVLEQYEKRLVVGTTARSS